MRLFKHRNLCKCGFSRLVCLDKVAREVICFDKWFDPVVVRAYLRGTNDKSFDRLNIFASSKIMQKMLCQLRFE